MDALFLARGRLFGKGVGEVDGFWQKRLASVAAAATAGGEAGVGGNTEKPGRCGPPGLSLVDAFACGCV